jgi:dipeptidyl aminopeptidase/acylaminoacyl peptidase
MEWPSKTIKTVVDVVHTPSSNEDFPGLFATELNTRSWDGDHLYVTMQWKSSSAVVKINVQDGNVTRIKCSTHKDGSISLLDTLDGKLLLLEQTPTIPYRVLIRDQQGNDELVAQSETQFEQVQWYVKEMQVEGGIIECIFLEPPADQCMFIFYIF